MRFAVQETRMRIITDCSSASSAQLRLQMHRNALVPIRIIADRVVVVTTIGYALRDAAVVKDGHVMSSRPLKILVVDQARGVWGAQRYALRLAPLLRDLGMHLTLAGPRSLELHDVWRDAGFDATDLDLPIERNVRNAGRPSAAGIRGEIRNVLKSARLIAGLGRAGGYDALWANGHWTHLETSIAGRLCGVPAVLHLHEESVPGLGGWLRAGAVRLAAGAVAVSQGVATSVPRLAAKRIRVIPNGVDTVSFSPPVGRDMEQMRELRKTFGIGVGDVMVLAATRLDPVKRIDDLIGAVRALDDPRVRLVVAGSTSAYPDYERRMRAEAEKLPAGRIILCGNRSDIGALFRASDLVIHAGIVEGMPLGLLEAQACGKPVIAYDVAGVPEAVLDGRTGILAARLDVEGLTTALRKLTGDYALRTQMGTAARQHVLAHHRIGDQAEQNAAVLREVCRRSSTVAR